MPGLGIGAGFQIPVLVVQAVLPMEDVPVATACVQFFQAFGGAIFIAVSQTLFQNGLISGISSNAPGIDPTIFINSGASQVRDILAAMGRQDAVVAVLTAYMSGLRNTYYISTAAATAAFLACLGLEWKSGKNTENGKPTAVAAEESAAKAAEAV